MEQSKQPSQVEVPETVEQSRLKKFVQSIGSTATYFGRNYMRPEFAEVRNNLPKAQWRLIDVIPNGGHINVIPSAEGQGISLEQTANLQPPQRFE